MVRVGDIDTPVYETIDTCELNIHISMSDFSYTEMTFNKETNEYYLEKEIPLHASIGFYSASHVSNYKVTVDERLCDTLVYAGNLKNTRFYVNVGGLYRIYLNASTYEARLELVNLDTASYYCQHGFNIGEVLKHGDAPYLFEYEFLAQGEKNDPYVSIPKFYPSLGMAYKLTVIDKDECVFADDYLPNGKYKLTINLKDFTLTVENIPE